METMFIKLLNMSITASWIVLAVIILRLLLKKAPKAIRCILWGMVGLRLILPVSLKSVLSLIPSTETVPSDIIYSSNPTIHSGIPILNSTVNPVIMDRFTPIPESTVTPMQTVTFIASIVWLCGIAVMVLYALISYLNLRSQIKVSIKTDKNIWLCDRVSSPFILGIIRPKIYIPSSIDQNDKEYVISHERVHIRRGDHLWKSVGFAILTVYWFNPIMWIAYILLCRDIELACDEKVISEMGEGAKKSYLNALINCSSKQHLVTACPLAFGEIGVKKRVKSVLNYKKPAFWIIIIAIIACIAISVFFLTDPKSENTGNDSFKYSIGSEDLEFEVTDIIYNDGSFSYIQEPESIPHFYISKDMQLLTKDYYGGTKLLGELYEIELNEEKFDSRFVDSSFKSIEKVKKNNHRMWEVYGDQTEESSRLYIVLEQKDGSVYIGDGYYNWSSLEGKNPDASMIRWLYSTKVSKGKATDMTEEKPYFVATIIGFLEDSVYVDIHEGSKWISPTQAYVSLDIQSDIPMPDIEEDDVVEVVFDGIVQETYPLQVPNVYSITYYQNETVTLPEDAQVLMCFESPDMSLPIIRLSNSDNRFSFTYSLLSSHICMGVYELTEDKLILNDDDGKSVYCFKRQGAEYVFDAQNSSELPKYNYNDGQGPQSPVPDGAVFKSSVEFNEEVTVESFSFAEDEKNWVSGMVASTFISLNEPIKELTDPGDALRYAAQHAVTVSFDKYTVAFDPATKMWRMTFSSSYRAGGDQTVYLSTDGASIHTWYGE